MKKRIDQLLAERQLAPSREKAKALIMSGNVYVGEQKVLKAGEEYDENADIRVTGVMKYVSRGGLKLEKAMEDYGLSLAGRICADIGSSTGGFTDCMLQCGASRVYSVDVGYGQLAWKLRQDPRVVVLERTNARYLTEKQIPDRLDFFSMDVSFISVKLIIPALIPLLSDSAEAVILIKPQFEAGRGKVGKNGVVRDAGVHQEVLENVAGFLEENGFGITGLTYSPIKGPKGNIEFLAYVRAGTESREYDIEELVKEAHQKLSEE
ncbi:MAG: TlyA family RNA methyltransferase [Oscillospiraceae bacterium]|nr:TlyA family RNA methyltransferase [Oscillospiraceae bacterium]